MQNKLLLNQSSVSLQIEGLPDLSNNEKKDQISIISQWKLTIINKPLIEGKIEHLGPIMDAFYIYSYLVMNDRVPSYQSKLIDIKAEDLNFHTIVLKSSKENVKPLIIKIGNPVLSDIVNCFDQLNESSKVSLKKSDIFNKFPKKASFGFENKVKFFNFLLPPFIAICSLILISSPFIYFYNSVEDKEKNELFNTK